MQSNFPDYDISELVKKFPDVYILDENFNTLDIIDDYTSLIWVRRYYETGDFELYVNASEKNRNLIKLGRFVRRFDDEEIFRIEKYEITTSVEEGDFITASGRDLRGILYQRCIMFPWTYSEVNLETLARLVVHSNFIDTTHMEDNFGDKIYGEDEYGNLTEEVNYDIAAYDDSRRVIPHMSLGEEAGITTTLAAYQLETGNVGDWLADLCESHNWGWRVRYEKGTDDYLKFELYKGTDRTKTIAFAEEFENLLDTSYSEDRTDYRNSYLVNDDDNAFTCVFSTSEGIDRYEDDAVEVDLESIGTTMSWSNLISQFHWAWDGGKINCKSKYKLTAWSYKYVVTASIWFDGYDFPLYGDTSFEEQVKSGFPNGEEITQDGIRYWHTDEKIFCCNQQEFTNGSWYQSQHKERISPEKPSDWDDGMDDPSEYSGYDDKYWLSSANIPIPDLIRKSFMQTTAYANINLYMRDTEFKGTIDPFATYAYKEDYFLGDLVTVKTKFGLRMNGRITEAQETFDSDGASLEVSFTAEGEQG